MSTQKDRPAFDKHAGDYREVHRQNIRASGEDPEYFAEYKAKHTASRLKGHPPHESLRILDFGCGIGSTIPQLRKALPNAVITGADPSGESVRIARESLPGIADFHVIDGEALPFEDGTFDAVVVACVFHHIPPDKRPHWIAEIHRVTRPGGHLFVFEHNTLNPLTLKAVRDCPFDEDAILLPKKELVQLTDRGGYGDVDTQYIVFFPRILSYLRPLEPSLGWIPFGAQYVVHAIA